VGTRRDGTFSKSNAPTAAPMETAILASTILSTFEEARSQLIGKSVVLTDGKAGAVEDVWLDELHGLRVSIKGHDGEVADFNRQTRAGLASFQSQLCCGLDPPFSTRVPLQTPQTAR